MFKKILIANRGEIAVRIAKTLQQMGIGVVCVYSEADENSPHLKFADEAYLLPGRTPTETYLSEETIIKIAMMAHAEAIHPGYGFLSENSRFAKACIDAGLTFIGPSPDAIQKMGDKLLAKALAKQAGVPVIPGSLIESDDAPPRIKEKAIEIGYPLMIKAAGGGGGKGMRHASDETELLSSIEAAKREAQNAFGDDRVFMEKVLVQPRHIEFQIIGDQQGHTFHLFERDCSIQRRYQKIIEESPAPNLSSDLRAKMGDAAVKIAMAAEYGSLGTAEFMLDESGNYYFLEMNSRLQVEHPVTEMALQTDLIRLQVEVANGQELSLARSVLRLHGHALECRIYAEDPENNFVPSTGIIQKYLRPDGPSIRIDSGVIEGSLVTVDYDPMLAKVIVWGESRDEAIARMTWALQHFVILGVKTNLEFLQRLIMNPAFKSGNLHTQFIEEHSEDFKSSEGIEREALLACAVIASKSKPQINQQPALSTGEASDPWDRLGSWREL